MIKLLFIINPTAGNKTSNLTHDKILSILQPETFSFDISYTKPNFLADKIVKENLEKYDVFVAVGGDGTINEVGKELIGTNKKMAIIPAGSGNGLARSLGIPMQTFKALEVIKRMSSIRIDAIKVNDNYFFNMAGVGFDAYIARKFQGKKKRGLGGYAKLVARKFFNYKGKKYRIVMNGHSYHEKAFLISFANTSQYGNNAHIAPMAKYNDGVFELCVVKDFPRWKTPELAVRLFKKTIHHSPYYYSKSLEDLEIKRNGKIVTHLDGESRIFKKSIKIRVIPKALKVISGN